MNKKIYNLHIGNNKVSNTPEIDLDKNELQQFLFDSAEAIIREKTSDESLDREKEKILLTSGKVIDLSEIKNNLDSYFIAEASVYEKRFPQIFYDEIYRLNKWPIPKNKTIRKYVVGKFTNELIYMRFSNDGLLKLQYLNPYAKMFMRTYKHFQFLSDEGKILLDQFIYEAIECMSECTTWYEFRLKYGQKYNLNVQMRLFEDDNNLYNMRS